MSLKTRDPLPTDNEDTDTGDSSADRSAGDRVRWRVLLRPSFLVLAVLVGLVAAVGLAGLRAQQQVGDHRAAERAMAAAADRAEEGMRLLVGIDGQSSASNLDQLSRWAADDFAEQLTTLAATVTGVLAQGDVVSKGDVTAVGVEGTRADRATVLVAATALVTNSELPDGELRTYRMAVTLRLDEDDWKITEVEFLG